MQLRQPTILPEVRHDRAVAGPRAPPGEPRGDRTRPLVGPPIRWIEPQPTLHRPPGPANSCGYGAFSAPSVAHPNATGTHVGLEGRRPADPALNIVGSVAYPNATALEARHPADPALNFIEAHGAWGEGVRRPAEAGSCRRPGWAVEVCPKELSAETCDTRRGWPK